jgi:hypothetical protein
MGRTATFLDPLRGSAGLSAALRVWAGFAALLALAALPVFSTVLPPLVDYPNHLARMHLIAEGGNAFYAVRWSAIPDLAEDLIVPPLSRLLPLAAAAKLFLVMIFALCAGGALWLNRRAAGGWRLWPLLAFLLLYSRVFLWGFLNYLFGIGLALLGAALWLALEEAPRGRRAAASAIVAIAVYFAHIEAFVFYALVVVGLEAAPALAELRAGAWRALLARALTAAPQFLLPASLFLFGWRNAAAASAAHFAIERKADLLFSVFDDYSRPFDVACFLLFLGLPIALAASGRLGVAPRWRWPLALVFAAYLLAPSRLFGGSGVDHRLPVALSLLLVAASVPRFPSRRAGRIVAVGALALFALRLGVVERVWLRADRVYRADLAGIDLLPRGAKLALAYPPRLVDFAPVPLLHFPTLAIVRREAFVPTLFANPAQQPVAMRGPYAALAAKTVPQDLWSAFIGRNAAAATRAAGALAHYDDVAFLDVRPFRVAPSRCLAPLFRQPRFQIFSLLPSCRAGASRK